MFDEKELEEFIILKINNPELTRGDLFALFPHLEQLEKSPYVRRKLVEHKLKESEEAKGRDVLKQLDDLKKRVKINAQKQRALEVMEEALYHKDINIRYRAAVKALGRDYARESKLGELEAQSESAKENPDQPYTEPQGADAAMEKPGKV